MKLKHLQGTWDSKEKRGKYIGDQTYVELEINTKLQDMRGKDLRIPHICQGSPFDFWVRQYPDESLISFMHHNSEQLDNCDYQKVGHTYHGGCGYAGSTFEYIVDDITYKVRGGWSSGETHYNGVTGKDYTHCTVAELGQQYAGWGGMSVPISFLVEQIAEQNLPYKLVRGLGVDLNTVEAVHIDDVEKFIAQAGMWRPESYVKTGTRWASQYSDIEGPSKYRTRYIKDDIANVQVLN